MQEENNPETYHLSINNEEVKEEKNVSDEEILFIQLDKLPKSEMDLNRIDFLKQKKAGGFKS